MKLPYSNENEKKGIDLERKQSDPTTKTEQWRAIKTGVNKMRLNSSREACLER